MSASLAPIALFVYDRPEHTRRTLAALRANALASKSDLIVYADGPKSPAAEQRVQEVRKLVHKTDGFANVTIVERRENHGLAKNIIEGTTDTSGRYGRVIVLEDDIVTSPMFLRFMNMSLDRYQVDKRVWHISGWNYPIDPDGLPDAFFWRVMNCWGWGTWADRWEHYTKEPHRLLEQWSGSAIERFNLDGSHDFWGQIRANADGRLNTWAIFWYATIFEHGGLCLNPTVPYVRNIGHDGSGQNCGDTDMYAGVLNRGLVADFQKNVIENEIAVRRIKDFLATAHPSMLQRFLRRLRSLIGT